MRAAGWRGAVRVFGCVLVGLVTAGGGTSQAQGPAGASGQAPGRPQEAAFDLAKAQAGGLTRIAAPVGQVLLVVSHRAPSATYRIRLGALDSTPKQQMEYARNFPGGTVDMSFRGVDPAQFQGPASEPGCAAWDETLQAFLREGDEAALPARIARVDAASGDSACPTARQMGGITTLAAAQLGPLQVAVGARTPLTVERLDASGAVVKRWQIELEGPTREPAWTRGSESEWLVAEVLSDVARLIEFAKRGALGDGTLDVRPRDGGEAGTRFSVQWHSAAWRPGAAELAIDSHIWAPQAYAGVVAGWLAEAGLRPRPAGKRPALVSRTTDLSVGALLAANTELSRQLADAPLDPGLHEQAAFLLGVSAWREQAGWYQDPRPALSAMTAHLALARGLRARGDRASAEGLLAEAMIEVLAERLVPARAVLEGLGKRLTQPAERAWIQALSLRAQAAPSTPAAVADDSLLVQAEHARHLRGEAGESALLAFVEGRERAPDTAWTRAILAGLAGGVEAGNTYSGIGVGLEFEEARTLLGVTSDEPQAVVTAIREALEAPGGRLGPGPRPVVASPAFWAASSERHLAAMAGAHWRHVRDVLGLEPDARALARRYGQWLESLPLFPLIALQMAAERQEARPCDAAQQRLLARQPERVTAAHWVRGLVGRCAAPVSGGLLTLPAAWFAPALPPGTAFDNASRLPNWNLVERLTPEAMERLHALAPRSLAVIEARALRALGRGTTAADIREAFGDATDQSRRALLALVALDPEEGERMRLRARLCDLEAEQCLTYGNELSRRDPVAAAAALERGVAAARDRVAVANNTYWLVDHYLEQGREDEALKVAALSADTYADLGLLTQARVFERLGRLEQAEAIYRSLQERYEKERALDCFYVRQAHRAPEGPYARQAQQAREALFPKGLQASAASALSIVANPRQDQLVTLVGRRFEEGYQALGARPGDIIRSVYGYEVWSDEQYACARTLVDSDELHLVVQRSRTLVELRGPFQRVKYGPVAPSK